MPDTPPQGRVATSNEWQSPPMSLEHLTLALFFSSMIGVILGSRLGFIALFVATAILIVNH